MVSSEKNSGNSEETQLQGRAKRKALLCNCPGRTPHTHFHTQTKGGHEHLSLLFFLFFSKVCSTKSLAGKLSAKRKHFVYRGPAWKISNIIYHKTDTARESAVKGLSRGEGWDLCEQIISTAASIMLVRSSQWCAWFATLLSPYEMSEELHGSQWRSWGELKLK